MCSSSRAGRGFACDCPRVGLLRCFRSQANDSIWSATRCKSVSRRFTRCVRRPCCRATGQHQGVRRGSRLSTRRAATTRGADDSRAANGRPPPSYADSRTRRSSAFESWCQSLQPKSPSRCRNTESAVAAEWAAGSLYRCTREISPVFRCARSLHDGQPANGPPRHAGAGMQSPNVSFRPGELS